MLMTVHVYLDGISVLIHKSVIIDILCDAADVISGHLTFRAVLVKGSHPYIRALHVRLFNEDYAVRTDAVVRRAEIDAQRLRTGYGIVKVLYEYIVISAGVHLCKMHLALFRTHVVDIHKLSIIYRIMALYDLS